MDAKKNKKYFTISIICHVIVLSVLIISFELLAPLAVFENTNKTDIISAVVLGDTAKSRILPKTLPAPAPVVEETKEIKPVKQIAKAESKPEP